MIPIFNPANHFWLVLSKNEIWSSKLNCYTTNVEPDTTPTNISNEQELSVVLANYGLLGPISIVPDQIPLWQGRAVLKSHGYFEAINAYIEYHKEADPVTWESFNMGNYFQRSTLIILAPVFGFSPEIVDGLMIEASSITV